MSIIDINIYQISDQDGMITIGTFRNKIITVMSFAPAFITLLLFPEWLIRSGRGYWQRRNEQVEEVCWSPRKIRAIFKNEGFAWVRAWHASPYFENPLITPGCRTLYLARKAP
jgi:hypothetical protein